MIDIKIVIGLGGFLFGIVLMIINIYISIIVILIKRRKCL